MAKIQCYAPIKIIGIKIIVPIKSKKSLRLMVHISPKYGAWRGNVKKVLQTEGGEGRWGQSVWSTFLRF